MSESCLSQKISLCRCIETLNDDGCLQVIRLLQNHQCLNQVLLQVVLKITDNMNVESLQDMNNQMKQIACNNKYVQKSPDNKLKNFADCTSVNTNQPCENIIFPLSRLPVDIIKSTSLFLNEQDIFNFEQCCRVFYQMINNLAYLKQSNNFREFILDDKKLNQIAEPKYTFYKYSQANIMKVTVFELNPAFEETNDSVTKFVTKTQSKWEQAEYIDKCYDHWLTNLFKSIESLQLSEDSTMALLDKLPSKLQRFAINHYWNIDGNFGHLQKAIDEFERQYLQLKQDYQRQGKKLKKLQCLDYSTGDDVDDRTTGPRYIESQHLILGNVCDGFESIAQQLLSTINNHVLTCHGFFNISKLDKIDCNIDTLRLIGFSVYNATDICDNDNFIEALNLNCNLVNLTIDINMEVSLFVRSTVQMQYISRWMKVMEKILYKQHYHNLKNVNILIEVPEKHIDDIFNMLKKNILILKHQFNQLNIGLQTNCNDCFKYCTFEWNEQIDIKFLNNKQREMDGNKMRYNQWLNQWTH